MTQTRSSQTMTQYLPNRGGFLTAHIIGQDYGEMNPKFIEEIYEELDSTLTVFDDSNRNIKVQWNGSCLHPLILTGWKNPRKFFGITGNKMILMTYVRTSSFFLQILPQPFHPYNLPSYHSYRTFHTDLTSFDVELTAYLVSGSQLTLTKDFATYIRKTKYKSLLLYGPSGDEFSCSILRRKKSTKIGKGWKEFVDSY
ncbi:hypothetical protein QL285_056210 [Trifolium repens]|nr:hypothetical protein QL285_056210 [Trifolium repens]